LGLRLCKASETTIQKDIH